MSEFTPDRYAMLVSAEADHFWFVARRELVGHLIGRFQQRKARRMLDLGCGSGFNLRFWTPFSETVLGADRLVQRSPYARDPEWRERLLAIDVEHLPFGKGSLDQAVALDLLEHVDDVRTLAELHECLIDGGLLVLTVPALPWLWSLRDERAGHRRRYTATELHRRLERAGFSVRYRSHYQFFLFPLLVLSRLWQRPERLHRREERPGPLLNGLLLGISRIEVWLAKRGLRFPWGGSLVMVAEKC